MRPLGLVLLLAALVAPGPVLAEEFVQEFAGVVLPVRDLSLSMGIGGVIARLPVKPGQRVKAGATLMVLDDRLQSIEAERRKVIWQDRAELEATQQRLAIVKSLYEDARKLYETGSISRDELRQLELDHIATQGRLEQLQAQEQRERLEYRGAEEERELRQLVAPVDGVVTWSELDVGEWAKPGEPLMRLVDASTCVLRVSVPLAMAGGLERGGKIPIRIEGLEEGATVEGEITFISPVADAASGLVELKIDFANPELRVRPGVKGYISWSVQQ